MSEIVLIPVTADLRSARPTVDGKLVRDNVELWYGRLGEVETVATTRGEALRSIAAGLEGNTGGRQDTLRTVGDDDEIATTDGGRVVNDPDEYKCEFCEITRPEAGALKAHLIAEHKREIASRHWAEHVEVGVLAPDGGEST